MKANTVARKLIAIILMVVMVTSVTAPLSFAVGEIGNPSGQEVELQMQEENSEKPDDSQAKDPAPADDKQTSVDKATGGSAADKKNEAAQTPKSNLAESNESKQAVESDEASLADDTNSEGASASIDMDAASETNNIVGDVFVNAVNTADDKEAQKERKESLEEYPLEPHNRTYYGLSKRVRDIGDAESGESNYLVYRDSYLILPQKDGKKYEVGFSEDGMNAVVSPAIPESELEGKTGVVFLRDNIGYDDILVFSGDITYNDDSMTVPIKKAEDITVNELFSDGKLTVSDPSAKKGLRSSVIIPTWTTSPSGTNWSGTISNGSLDNVSADVDIDIWKLFFELKLGMRFSFDFDITTTGSSGGRNTVTAAGVSIPVKGLLTIGINYNMQTEFDATPIHVKGKMTTDFSFGFGTYPAKIHKYNTSVKIADLDVKGNYNKDINFYIGSQLDIRGDFLSIQVDLKIFKISIGPVLSMALDCEGGCRFKARHDKDRYTTADRNWEEIHTCTAHGKDGCLELISTETERRHLSVDLDLYFDSWHWDPYDSGEKEIGTKQYYNSYTFNSGMQEGICPHRLFKVPVLVSKNKELTDPAENMKVTVTEYGKLHSDDRQYAQNTTGSDGNTVLHLPYVKDHHYTFTAEGIVDNMKAVGSAKQPDAIQTKNNPQVNIIIASAEQYTINTNFLWNVDIEKKEVPGDGYTFTLWLYRRDAGTDDSWELMEDYSFSTDLERNWATESWTAPKYRFSGDRAVLNEYTSRMREGGAKPVIMSRRVNGYVDAAGTSVSSHSRRFHIDYEDSVDGNTSLTNVKVTAVSLISLNKKWKISGEKADSVYLALVQQPEEGWDQIAAQQKVSNEWLLIKDMYEGSAVTIKQLIDEGVMTSIDDWSSIENIPLSIGKVNDGNNWHVDYTVPAFRNGVRLKYMGKELDSSVLKTFSDMEYGIARSLDIKQFGNYSSFGGIAASEDNVHSGRRIANVINTDPLEKGEILGSVFWYSDDTPIDPPDYVELTIKRNGEAIGEPLRLNKSDYGGQDTWIWTKKLGDYNPDDMYTVEEKFPSDEDKAKWAVSYNGLNVTNYMVANPTIRFSSQATFDYDPTGVNEINTYIAEKDTENKVHDLVLSRSSAHYGSIWTNSVQMPSSFNSKDISAYKLVAPDIPGYVKEYDEPYESKHWITEFRQFNYTVHYYRQSDLKIKVHKEWEPNESTNPDYPDAIEVEINRDNEIIAHGTLRKGTDGKWQDIEITKDEEGNPLTRLDADGHKYVYTVWEKPVDGWTSKVSTSEVLNDQGPDEMCFNLTNTWVGDEYVNVKGSIIWKGDEGHENLRPQDGISIAVLNADGENIKTIRVPVNNNSYEAKYLPLKDSDGNRIEYRVMEDHVYGYTITYSDPVINKDGSHEDCIIDITNTLTGYFPLKIKKIVDGSPQSEEEYVFKVTPKAGKDGAGGEGEEPVNAGSLKITGAGEVTADLLLDNPGLYLYSVEEEKGTDPDCKYDETEKMLILSRTRGANGQQTVKSWVVDDASGINWDEIEDSYSEIVEKEGLDNLKETDTVEFTNRYPKKITVKKTWDIDLENLDKPDSIDAVVQEKKDGEWKNVALVELNDANDWQAEASVENKGDEYRVRELKEETALGSLVKNIRETISSSTVDTYQQVINTIKTEGGSYYNALPESVRKAIDEGEESLKKELDATSENLYDKLIEQLGLTGVDNRIVYDKDDDDKGENTANEVVYSVEEHESIVAGGTEPAHKTKYRVKYSKDKDGDTYTIDNKAILEIDVIKRWLFLGDVDAEDKPDKAYVVLMCKPDPKVLENAKGMGADISDILDYEFPVMYPLEGGVDPLSFFADLALGIDISWIVEVAQDILSIFGVEWIIPTFAIGKVNADNNWTYKVVDSKYTMGIPMEYKGAELSSELIRQIVKYITEGWIDLPVSFNPFDGYLSIPTKAIRTVLGIENWSDIVDGSAWDALKEKGKNLTYDDIKNFGPQSLLTDDLLMANVINVKIDIDPDNPTHTKTLEGSKIWKDDKESDRPDYIKLHIKKNGTEIHVVTLNKSDNAGKSEWEWEYELQNPDYLAYYSVTEEYPENYSADKKKHYTTVIDGLDIINVWNDDIQDKVTISGSKVWLDYSNMDNMRPKTITVYLKANGERVKNSKGEEAKAVTSKAGGWKYSFPYQPRYDDQGNEIEYSVEEAAVEGYTTIYAGYNIINSRIPDPEDDKISASGVVAWKDTGNQDGIRPESVTVKLLANGEEKQSCTVSAAVGWKWKFTDLPVSDEQGNTIDYTVEEAETDVITGTDGYGTYSYKVEGTAAAGFVITNKHTPLTVNISGSKTWDDDNDRDGRRPDLIVINLLADGEKVDSKTARASNGWKWDFADMPKFKSGNEISYTIIEDPVSGYSATVDDYDVTNKHEPEKKAISVRKAWMGESGDSSKRPEKITFHLLADGNEVASKSVDVSDDSNAAEYNFDGLWPVYRDHGIRINYTITEDPVTDYTTQSAGNTVVNTYAPEKTQVNVHKVWDDNDDQDGIRPQSVTVKLLKNGKDSGKTLTISEASSWNATFTDLDKNEHGNPISYSVAEIRTDVITGTDAAGTYESKVSGDAESGFIITNKHTPIKRGISVKKVWDDDDNADGQRPSQITLRLRANGNEVDSKSVTEQDGWKCTFENVDVYKGGRRINYAVTEDAVENYTTSVSGDAETGFTVSNKHNPGKTQVQVFKLWLDADNQDGKRPETITVHLLADGEDTGKTLILSEDNNWMGSFDDINRKKNGRDISYSVTEDPVPGYRMVLWGNAENGYVIINLTELQTKTINVRKVWDDNDNQDGKRPDMIVVRLMANGREVTARELTEANGWKESFEGVDVNSGGKKITYSISEDPVEGYTTSIAGNDDLGYTVTNSYKPEETQVKVQKIWTDNNNQDGKRPASVVVRLLADGADSGKTVELCEANQWQASFDGLDKKAAGKDIVYTVAEDAVDAYHSEIRGSAVSGYYINNIHEPEKRNITVRKIWNDNDNQDGNRPERIIYRLKANGIEVDSKAVTDTGDWQWTFNGLPKYKDGELINYTVSEDRIEGYTSSISGNMTDGFTVTNTHAPDKTQVNVSKRWSDDNNRDHIRPAGITVKLLADGEDSGRELELTEANGWKGTFDNLDLKSRGKKITYTVEEEKTSVITGKDGPGTYRNAVTGDADTGFTIINIHTPETISLSGSKTWEDGDDQDNKRPESITVRLWSNEVGIPSVVDARTVKEADEWKWTFEDLPKYSDGREIRYTLSEDYIEGYTSEIDGMDITNSYTPKKTQVTVYKWWNDDEDRDGRRPESTKITVYKVNTDGSKAAKGTLTLNDDNDWMGTVNNLDKYENIDGTSREIKYVIEETLPDGYSRWWDWDGTGEFKNMHILVDYHEPETVTITGTKVWNDKDDQDGVRPDKVRIYLYANGELRDFEIEAKAENNWEWTNVRDCYKYYDKGKLVEYTIEEESVEGYASKVKKTGKDFTLTNTHDPETITLSGKKTWDDSNNNDGARPLFITVRLKADGREVDSKIVTALNSWKWEFKDVPKNSLGREIIYTVTEDVVDDYTSVISGMDVTNKHTPDKTQVYVTKVWDDANDQDGIRPDSVTVKLLADGEDTGTTLVLNEDNKWSGSFDNLNARADGKDIEYTVEEVKTSVVTGEDSAKTYAVAVSGDAKKGYTITNTHTPWYTITYKLNGGDYNGSTADIIERYQAETKISIHEAPSREGYEFLYWKGSEYQPGDKYTVTEDHVFTAQWKNNAKPGDPDDTDKPDKPDRRVRTGDETNIILWIGIMISAAMLLTVVGLLKRRRDYNE